MKRVILASGSAVRARLLAAAGVSVEAIPARVDEDAVKDALIAQAVPMRGIADALAELKALRVSASNPDSLVLGADQLLVFGNELESKSGSLAEARVLLRRLRGKKHELISAAVMALNGAPIWRHVDRVVLTMWDFSDEFLDDYLQQEGENILGSVGCYHFEGRGAQLFTNVAGDYFSILGLPLLPVLSALREHGVTAS